MSLAERIRQARKTARLSQVDLAARVGVSSQSVSQWESGSTKALTGENLLRAAAALGVNPAWLATGRGAMAAEAATVADTAGEYTAMVTDDERAVVAYFRALGATDRRRLLAIAAVLAGERG